MQRRTLVLMLVLAAAIACGAAWLVLGHSAGGATGAAGGSGVRHALPAFRHVDVEGFLDVELVAADTESARVDMPPRAASPVTLEVRGDTLAIRGGEPRRWWQVFGASAGRQPRVLVEFRRIDGIRIGGAVKLHAASIRTPALAVSASGAAALKIDQLDTEALQLAGAGAVKADLAGRAPEQEIELAGAGLFRGGELAGERVRVSVSGAGKASVKARDTLEVAISGAGLVDYTGEPKVTQQISGAGKIRRRSADDGSPERLRIASPALSPAPVARAG